MIFLFGERIKRESTPLGERPCTVCQGPKPFQQVRETNYFCLFGLRTLPLEKISNYEVCEHCENAFRPDAEGPSQLAPARRIIAYVLLGYGMHEHRTLARDIFKKVTGFELSEAELNDEMRALSAGKLDVLDDLRAQSQYLNTRGKQQVIEAAFLATHACCEIQYEDRLRINLIGNAMNLPIAFISAAIDQVRQQGCYGVHRILPTQTQA